MTIDATFWVGISFILFFGGLVYLKVPQKINEILSKLITDIKNDEKVLHIGGLTGYLSVLISKLCNKIYVTDNDQSFVDNIIKNFSNNEITNGKVFKEEFSEGLKSEGLYDLIVIDCPQYNFNLNLLNQVNMGGRIIYIEKINEELSKAYKMIKYEDNFSKVFLFDVFSNFYLTKQEERFNF